MFDYNQLKNIANWSEKQIGELKRARRDQIQLGKDSLTGKQKRLLIGAKCDMKKVTEFLKNPAPATANPMEKKTHYRWVAEEVFLFTQIEAPEGFTCAEKVTTEEILRALDIFQPKLDMYDVGQRSKVYALREDLCNLGGQLGFAAHNPNGANHIAHLKKVFPDKWNTKWDFAHSTLSFIPNSELEDFRSLCRTEIEEATVKAYCSIRKNMN